MTPETDSLFAFVNRLYRETPELIQLATAKTDEEFEAAFDLVLDKTVRGLEANKVNFETLGEEGLSADLAHSLSMPGIAVMPEMNSNGHVDVVIYVYLCNPRRTKLCEAKIYDGPAYHIKGMRQLLNRYSTGRESRLLLISYVRKRNIKGLIDGLRKRLDRDRPLSQKGPTRDHTMKWSFLSSHVHSSGEILHVGHVGCNLHIDA
jgi:hypothetical protein